MQNVGPLGSVESFFLDYDLFKAAPLEFGMKKKIWKSV